MYQFLVVQNVAGQSDIITKVVVVVLLQDMGFFDQEANIRALQATGGNVNAAVDRLLQGFP